LSDTNKTKDQLVAEVAELHQWISEVEKVEIEHLQVEEALRRRNRELELLNRAAQAFNSTLDLDQVLSHVLEEVCRLLGAVAASIWLIETKRNAQEGSSEDLVCRRTVGDSCEVVRSWHLPLGQGIAGWVACSGKGVMVPYTRADGRYFEGVDKQTGVPLHSILAVPLRASSQRAGQNVIGVLQVVDTEVDRFDAEDMTVVQSLAASAAIAIENARLYEESQMEIAARAQLAQTYQRLNMAIDQTAESVVILDTQRTIVYANCAFERITGYSRSEAVGQTLDMLRSDEYVPAFFEGLWATVKAGQVWHGRIVNRKEDGTLYTDETTITPIRDEHGAIVNYVVVKRDVTPELQLEEQLRQGQKMEAVGQLTAGIAHEFSNLVTAINGFAELAQLQLSPDHPVQKLVSKVRQSSRHATGLIRQLLAFSHAQIVEPAVLDLNAVVAEMSKMLQWTIGEDIELVTRPTPDLWSVKVDPAHIEQVIVNLVVNARDAMPAGGRLRIETANVILDEDYVAHHVEVMAGEYVMLTVSDTGTGMSEEVKAHLFEPFFTTKERGEGTGLGLATVYGIVRHSGGHIRVNSEPGKGATFTIYLPRCTEAVPPSSRPDGSWELPLGGDTVLVVEDDDPVREMARLILEEQGYLTLDAKDGQKALEVAVGHAGPIHLLLTDVVLPGMSGKELADRLAESQRDLKTLYMSGYGDEAIAHHGLPQPNTVVLQKPFHPLDLARRVRKVLDHRR
jgi:two-component system cell cycle sensor histidine kinase/response regulator CckA